MDELLRQADVVTMHARVCKETIHMIGEREFSLMKPNAIFINTARAALVDEKALIQALQTGKIRGAGLDVYEKEGGMVENIMEFPREQMVRYGALVGAVTDVMDV